MGLFPFQMAEIHGKKMGVDLTVSTYDTWERILQLHSPFSENHHRGKKKNILLGGGPMEVIEKIVSRLVYNLLGGRNQPTYVGVK